MEHNNVFRLIKSDFFRYVSDNDSKLLIIAKYFHNPGMQFSVIYRLEHFLIQHNNYYIRFFGLCFYPFYFVYTYYFLTYHIEPWVEIGEGLFLHNHDIVVADSVNIGKNFTCMGQVTIGLDFTSGDASVCILDDVRIGAGAKIISKGKVLISRGVTIGANSVVTKSIVIENSTWVGIPAKIVKK